MRKDDLRGKKENLTELDGVGGKIEIGESVLRAMSREFKEETSVDISDFLWTEFCEIEGDDFIVNFLFRVVDWKTFYSARTSTDELIGFFDSEKLPKEVIPNLRWLIPMALTKAKSEQNFYYKIKEIS